jgi:pyridoxine 5-phosphate synthase
MKLGLNIDHVATIRQARGGFEPDPVAAAVLATLSGADSIVCHLREDRRHLQDRDLVLLRQVVQTRLNMEMAPTQEMIEKALQVRPAVCTFVPEKREERTTEGGLDVSSNLGRIKEAVTALNASGIEVSLFINPQVSVVRECVKTEAQAVELHTGLFAEARDEQVRYHTLEDLRSASIAAAKLGFFVAAGHGLNYHNVSSVASLPEIQELNIGHAIIARAVFVGLPKALEDMRYLIDR